MASYRIYRVGRDDRLTLGETFVAADDAAAVEIARVRLDPGGATELWEGGRLVGRFSKTGQFLPGAG